MPSDILETHKLNFPILFAKQPIWIEFNFGEKGPALAPDEIRYRDNLLAEERSLRERAGTMRSTLARLQLGGHETRDLTKELDRISSRIELLKRITGRFR